MGRSGAALFFDFSSCVYRFEFALSYAFPIMPAPAMKAYIAVRQECEQIIQQSGLNATILRPWYVLGPGHRWPQMLLPMYWLMERIPPPRANARYA
jgi:uncharacterized protein YbjT (DUF2867 family)